MGWTITPAGALGIFAASLLASLILTLAADRWFGRLRTAMAVGVVAPPLSILAVFFYLESQQSVGPFYAVVGIAYLLPCLLSSLGGAGMAAFLLSGRD